MNTERQDSFLRPQEYFAWSLPRKDHNLSNWSWTQQGVLHTCTVLERTGIRTVYVSDQEIWLVCWSHTALWQQQVWYCQAFPCHLKKGDISELQCIHVDEIWFWNKKETGSIGASDRVPLLNFDCTNYSGKGQLIKTRITSNPSPHR